jgi:hypothetical protein
VHNTITDAQLFQPGEKVAIGASGGKGMFLISQFIGYVQYRLTTWFLILRFYCPGAYHEDSKRPLQIRVGTLPLIDRRRHYGVSR